MTTTTLAAVQMHASARDVANNLAKAEDFIKKAADGGARLVLLPELFNVGYFIGPELFELWETADGHTVTWMRNLAERLGMLVAGSIAEERAGRLFNTLFIAEPDGRLYRYAKREPTKAELAAFDPGDDHNIIETSLGRMGLFVCSDFNWGQSLLRPMVGEVDLILLPQATYRPLLLGRFIEWLEKRKGEAVSAEMIKALGAPQVSAGLIGPVRWLGRFAKLDMYGGTCVTDANGHNLAHIPYDAEGVAIADVTLGSTGGNRDEKLFKNPGLDYDVLNILVQTFPNLRPQHRSDIAGDKPVSED